MSTLRQHVLMVDIETEMLACKLATLIASAPYEADDASPDRPCNLANMQEALHRISPFMLVVPGEVCALTSSVPAANTQSIK